MIADVPDGGEIDTQAAIHAAMLPPFRCWLM